MVPPMAEAEAGCGALANADGDVGALLQGIFKNHNTTIGERNNVSMFLGAVLPALLAFLMLKDFFFFLLNPLCQRFMGSFLHHLAILQVARVGLHRYHSESPHKTGDRTRPRRLFRPHFDFSSFSNVSTSSSSGARSMFHTP